MQMKMVEPIITVFFGLTGSGKSYLAGRWAVAHELYYLNSDEVRKQISGVAPASRHHIPFNEGLYSPEMTRRTYHTMVNMAVEQSDRDGFAGAVLDGSYGKADQRDQVVAAFADAYRLVFIYCYCSEQVTRYRFSLRAEDKQAVSDGRWEIYVGQKRFFTVPEHIEGADLIKIDTDKAVEALIEEVDEVIGFSSMGKPEGT